MAKQSRNILKGYFETGKRPTEGQYANLIDTHLILDGENTGSLNLLGDTTLNGGLSAIHITASGNVSASGNLFVTGDVDVDGSSNFQGTILGTDITLSGDLTANDIFVSGLVSRAGDINTGLQFASDTVQIEGNNVVLASFNTTNITFPGGQHITASGNISASGYISASNFFGDGSGLTNITSTNIIQNVSLITASIATGSLYLTGSVTYLSGSTSVLLGLESSGSLLPGKDTEVDLGSPTKYWKSSFVSESHANKFYGTFMGAISSSAQVDHNNTSNYSGNEHFIQENITTVGTIGTGIWNGTKIANIYLDDDTAHLTTDQTFSGRKTFSAPITSSIISSSSTIHTKFLQLPQAGAGGVIDSSIHFGSPNGNNGYIYDDSTNLQIGYNDTDIISIHDTGINVTIAGNLKITDHITASGNIKVGKNLYLSASANGHITASGNVSASGTSHIFGGITTFIQSSSLTGSNAGISIQNISTGDSLLHFVNANNRWITGIDNDDADKFKIAGGGGPSDEDLHTNTRLTIMVDGKTGIGTSTPSSQLEVSGSVSASGDLTALNLTTPGNVSASFLHLENLASPAIKITDTTNNGYLEFEQRNVEASFNILGSGSNTNNLTIGTDYKANYIYLNGTTGVTTIRGHLEMIQGSTGANSPAHITASGNISSSGNIIGNIDATNVTASGDISASGTITGLTGSFGAIQGPGFKIDAVDGANSVIEADSNHLILQTIRGGDSIKLNTSSSAGGPTTKMFVSSSGNVGIGTSTPGEKLEVVGNISSSGTGLFGKLEVATGADITGSLHLTGSTSDLKVDGTVGIGTAAPTAANVMMHIKSNVVSADPTVIIEGGGASDDATIQLKNADVNWSLSNQGGGYSDSFLIRDTSTALYPFAIDPTAGGIGTAPLLYMKGDKISILGGISPTANLHVSGNILIDGPNGHITASGNISASGTIYANNFQSAGGDIAGISFTDDLVLTGHLTSSGNISSSGDITATGTGSFAGGIDLEDNQVLKIGTGDDLQIYHDGSNSYIKDTGTGNLLIDATNLRLRNAAGEDFLFAVSGSYVKLYYDNVEKIATTATGINVTGEITSSGNISSSQIITSTIQTNNDNLGLTIVNPITASNNISSSGTVIASAFTGTLTGTSTGLTGTPSIAVTNITASGNISASGTVYASKFESAATSGEIISFNDNINLTGHLTASGNISSSGTGSFSIVEINGGALNIKNTGQQSYARFYCESANAHYTEVKAQPHAMFGSSGAPDGGGGYGGYSTSGGDSGNNALFILPPYDFDYTVPYYQAHVTASGNISSSGTVTGLSGSFSHILGNSPITVQDIITFQSHVTASGNISSSATLIANEANIIGNITASGNISASGEIFSTTSASFSTRITTAETELAETLLSSSAQIATEISGAFVAPSSSFSTRVTTLEGNPVFSAASISGSLSAEAIASMSLSNITASGNISASGTITGLTGSFTYLSSSGIITAASYLGLPSGIISGAAQLPSGTISGSAQLPNGTYSSSLQTLGNITSSGNISSSGTITGLSGSLLKLGVGTSTPGTTVEVVGDVSASGTITAASFTGASTGITGTPSIAVTHVTASNISASGDILVSGSITSLVTGSFGYVKSSGDISSSGTITAATLAGTLSTAAQTNITSLGTLTSLNSGHITSSGNVSASGIVYAEHLYSSDDAEIVDSLTIGGTISNVSTTNITASGNISGSSISTLSVGGNSTLGNVFSGEITSSGNISSSATITAEHFYSSDDAEIVDSLTIGGTISNVSTTHVTASGNISGSSISTITVGGALTAGAGTLTTLNASSHITASGNISSSGIIYTNILSEGNSPVGLTLTGNITASGNISSSGNITLGGGASIGGNLGVSGTTNLQGVIIGGNTTLGNSAGDKHIFTGNITASGNISASGTITSNIITPTTITNVNTTHITASGNISSSTLIVNNHITASGNISSSGIVKALTLEGRSYYTGSSNSSAVSVFMTEANYPGGSVIGVDMNSATNDIQLYLPSASLSPGLKYTFITNTNAGSGATFTLSTNSDDAGDLAGMAMCRDGNERILGTNFLNVSASKGDKIEAATDGLIWSTTVFCSASVSEVSTT